MFDDVPTSKLN